MPYHEKVSFLFESSASESLESSNNLIGQKDVRSLFLIVASDAETNHASAIATIIEQLHELGYELRIPIMLKRINGAADGLWVVQHCRQQSLSGVGSQLPQKLDGLAPAPGRLALVTRNLDEYASTLVAEAPNHIL